MFEPHRRHCVVSLSKNINPSLVLVQPRKIRPFITERLLMGCKESNQTKTFKIYRTSCIKKGNSLFTFFTERVDPRGVTGVHTSISLETGNLEYV